MPCLNNTAYSINRCALFVFVHKLLRWRDENLVTHRCTEYFMHREIILLFLLFFISLSLCLSRSPTRSRFWLFNPGANKKHTIQTLDWVCKTEREREQKKNENKKNYTERSGKKCARQSFYFSVQHTHTHRESYTDLSSSCHNSISNPWIRQVLSCRFFALLWSLRKAYFHRNHYLWVI